MLDTIKLLASKAWKVYIWPVLQLFLKRGFLNLLDIVYEFVLEADNFDMTGDEKRKWVADKIREHSWHTGNKIADSAIAFLIELAVQRLKSAE